MSSNILISSWKEDQDNNLLFKSATIQDGRLNILCDGIKIQKDWGTFPPSGAIEFSNWVSREQFKAKTFIHSAK